jgi:hypothetical protein
VRSRWHFFAILFLAALGAAGILAFTAQQDGLWRTAGLALSLVVSTVWALLGWLQTPVGGLQWDGQHWYASQPNIWQDAQADQEPALRQVHIVFDFQRLLLVRTKNQRGQNAWAWLAQGANVAHWLSMRRALVGSSGLENPRMAGSTEPSSPHP